MTDQTEAKDSGQTKAAETPPSDGTDKTTSPSNDGGTSPPADGADSSADKPEKRRPGRPATVKTDAPKPAPTEAEDPIIVTVTNHSGHTLIDPESGKFITACSITTVPCFSKDQVKRLKDAISELRALHNIDKSKLFYAVESQ